jgi:hypothetical protein
VGHGHTGKRLSIWHVNVLAEAQLKIRHKNALRKRLRVLWHHLAILISTVVQLELFQQGQQLDLDFVLV